VFLSLLLKRKWCSLAMAHQPWSPSPAPPHAPQHTDACCLLQVQAKLALAKKHSMDGLNFDLEQPIK
jgi:hypothetical protein